MSETWSLPWHALNRRLAAQGAVESANSWLSRALRRSGARTGELPRYCPLTVMLARQYRSTPPS